MCVFVVAMFFSRCRVFQTSGTNANHACNVSALSVRRMCRDYVQVSQDIFQTEGDDVALYFLSTDAVPIDFASQKIRTDMTAAADAMRANPYTLPGTFDSWLEAFEGARNTSTGGGSGAFYTDLAAFLSSPAGARYTSDVVFSQPASPAAGIESCRFQFNWIKIDNAVDKIDAMDSSRATAAEIPPPLGTNAFVYGSEFLQIEQYATIGKEALTNIGLAFLMIAVIIVVLLANPVASVITFLCVASAILELIGIMYFIDFRIDSVTVIFLVISLGLAVDYSVHVAHGFLAARVSDMETRIKQTLMVRCATPHFPLCHLFAAFACGAQSVVGALCVALVLRLCAVECTHA